MMKTDAKSQQIIEGAKSGGSVKQPSNLASDQTIREVDAASDIEQVIEIAESDLQAVSTELLKLHAEILKYDPNATAELDRLKNAEKAASEGDAAGVANSLKGTARWVLDFATRIGTSVVAKLIETKMGL